ncbi:hypothetical protein [Neorhodopirellula pilleata]|uniref:Uncharacterized protein n=1 Tax=Neorhodopirellula pilleata TaxID=2714738 RepID=A0A5C6AG76_9BACT|nr:hypothetical protein [Neorhodopirellula pilleata]TWT99042.1 hypothetical protein Pla100_22160 [Neorhodopirellula pilleata]
MNVITKGQSRWHRHRFGVGAWVVLLGLLAGCQRSDRTEIVRTEVKGQVFLDGKPLTSGVIEFEAVDAGVAADAEDADSPAVIAFAVVSEGAYHIDAAEGPVVGVNQVRVRPAPLPREQLEAMLDVKSTSRRRSQPLVVQEIHPDY